MRLEGSVVVGIGGLKDQVARQTLLKMASVSSTSRAERVVKSLCRECPTTARNPKIDAMTRSSKTHSCIQCYCNARYTRQNWRSEQ